MERKPIFIPPYCGEDVKSNAERKMFDILQNLELKNAYVLHSLGLPKHQSKIYGEIDFVVVCERGIACLEIKGGRVECREGKWLFTDRYGNEWQKNEGPFAQITGNMFAIKNALKTRFKNNHHFKNILVAAGVVFPDIEFKSTGQEIITEIIYDQRNEDISQYIAGIFDYWKNRQHREPSVFSRQNIKEIVDYLRGEFHYRPTLGSRLDDTDKYLFRYTEEQMQMIKALSINRHLVIQGGAGTGKTLIATDYALREAGQDLKVLYLTFNKNLANYLIKHIGGKQDSLKIVNIHALFGEYVDIDAEEIKRDSRNYFGEVLPELFYDYVNGLSESDLEEEQFDVLVMDEAQDIIKANYLFNLDFLLRGGLEKGKWAVFYDEKQNLFNPSFEEGIDILNSYATTQLKLFINCRNTKQIGEFNAKLSKTDLNEFIKENGEEVSIIKYASEVDFKNELIRLIKELKKEKVPLKDIVFLSPKRYENSRLIGCLDTICQINVLSEKMEAANDQPLFATIQGFKGLDSKVVILIDMDKIYDHNFSKYVYTAISRARTKLYVLVDENLYKDRFVSQ